MNNYVTAGGGAVASLSPDGVALRSLCAIPEEGIGTSRWKTWWSWADAGHAEGPSPGFDVTVTVDGTPLPAHYGRLNRSYWLLVFPAPIAGGWVAIHGNMRIAPDQLSLRQVQLADLPAMYPLPPLTRARKPRGR